MKFFWRVSPIFILTAAIVIALGVLAWPTGALAQSGPPPIPHPVDPAHQDCLSCHQQGVNGAPKFPDNHAGRTNDMCLGCHTQGASAPTSEPPAATPSGPAPLAPTPIVHPKAPAGVNTCVDCHSTLEGSQQIVKDWQSSFHAERGVTCADCHGGDPGAKDKSVAMSARTGFIGKPDRTKIPELCGSCHADVTLMRQYDLPTDQFAKYLESFHGQKLAKGDTKVATCFDCHDGHATHETNDPSASVYRLNVPALCARCHADPQYMAGYNIPTNQYSLYKQSVHGIALLENQDTRAPSCATCHGTHGAAPPGFSEVSNVCGSCHSATQTYYLKSAHNSDSPDAPRCVTCHGRYDVQQPSEAMMQGSDPRHCGSCHSPDSKEGLVVKQIYDGLTSADKSLTDAEGAVNQASSLGMITAEEENLIADARTKLITARAAQHTASWDVVNQESSVSIDTSTKARQQAEAAIAEGNFRRQAMVIAIGAIGLVIVSLVLVRRELVK